MQAVAVDSTTGARLAVPHGWERRDEPSLVLARSDWPPSRGPRPTVALRVQAVPADADVLEVGLAAVAGARERGRHVLASDVCGGPEDVEGRHVVSVHRQGTGAVAVHEWWFVRAGLVTCVGATCGVDEEASTAPAFRRVLAGLVLPVRAPGDRP